MTFSLLGGISEIDTYETWKKANGAGSLKLTCDAAATDIMGTYGAETVLQRCPTQGKKGKRLSLGISQSLDTGCPQGEVYLDVRITIRQGRCPVRD